MTFSLKLLGAGLATAIVTNAASAQDAGERPSIPVTQKIGKLVCTMGEDNQPCGGNDFTITTHPDGTHTMEALQYRPSVGYHNMSTLHVGEDFRPLSGFFHFYISGEHAGSASYFVEAGSRLQTTVRTEEGVIEETIEVPTNFSMDLHPVVLDPWHVWYYDEAKGGEQKAVKCSAGAQVQGIFCRLLDFEIAYVGTETLTTKAGTFETKHYRIGDAVQIWTTGPEHVLVQYLWAKAGMRYELTELESRTLE